MATVSCIIPVYNAAPWLERAVQSLVDCRLGTVLEIVLVDDGSTDNSLEVANRIQSQISGVQVLSHPGNSNRGVSATRNLGLGRSTGELICLLDGDDYVYPHRFEAGLQILSKQPQVDAVYDLCEMVFADEQAKALWFAGQSTFGFTEPIAPDQLLKQLLKGRCWATSAILFRRSLLTKTGLFDPELKIAEDCHLWFRMAVAGKLVSGDLSRPVSAYWRTSGSAYQPGMSRRLEMLKSMQRFLQWLSGRPEYRHRVAEAQAAVRDYALNGIIAARSGKQKQLAWSLAKRSFQMFPSVAFDWRFQRQFLSMILGR